MRLDDSPEEASWRSEVRNFLDKDLPESIRQKNRGLGAIAVDALEDQTEVTGKPEIRAGGVGFRMRTGDFATWREKLASRGWIAPAWPTEYGGAGLDAMQQFILNEEFAEVGAPQLGGMGVSM